MVQQYCPQMCEWNCTGDCMQISKDLSSHCVLMTPFNDTDLVQNIAHDSRNCGAIFWPDCIINFHAHLFMIFGLWVHISLAKKITSLSPESCDCGLLFYSKPLMVIYRPHYIMRLCPSYDRCASAFEQLCKADKPLRNGERQILWSYLVCCISYYGHQYNLLHTRHTVFWCP